MKTNFVIIIYFISFLFARCSATKENETRAELEPLKEIEADNQEGNNIDNALDDLTNQIVTSLSEVKKSRLAILEFVDLDGKTTNFGKYIAEELITRLYRTKKFYVIERQLLNKVLEEHKLTVTGLIDENSAKELGKILGVDAIASGTVTELTNSVKVNSRLFSTETGSIFAVASSEIPKTSDVRKLLGVTAGYDISSNTNKETKSVNMKNYETGLKGEYFNLPPKIPNSLPDNPTFTRIDKIINFRWEQQSPASNISADYFGVRWTGMIFIPVTGTYKFNMGSDDGNRLWVDDKQIINMWRAQPYRNDQADIYLEGNIWYSIRVEYFEMAGGAAVFLGWIPVGENKVQEIPTKFLRTE